VENTKTLSNILFFLVINNFSAPRHIIGIDCTGSCLSHNTHHFHRQ